MHRDIVEQQEKLSRLFAQAKRLQKLDSMDDETKSGFVSYLCVRISGYVELAVKTTLREYSESQIRLDAPVIANFVDRQLEYTLNPWYSQILELVGKFSTKWKETLKESITQKQRDSLNSIVRMRNDIAHGVDVVLSLEILQQQFEDAKEVIILVNTVCV